MIGAVLSWGIAWPLLANREGDWYPAGLASHSFRGLFACELALLLPRLVNWCLSTKSPPYGVIP